MKVQKCNQEILDLLAGKASTKQLVFRKTKEVFKEFKALLKRIADELNSNICKIDKEVVVEYFDNGEFEEMEIMTFYQDQKNDLFVITALTEDDKITRIIVKNFPATYSITIEHHNPDNPICKESYYQNKY